MMVTSWPAMVSVPVLLAARGLAVTVKSTSPLPLPVEPLVMAIQSGLSVEAVHGQLAGAVTLMIAPETDPGKDSFPVMDRVGGVQGTGGTPACGTGKG